MKLRLHAARILLFSGIFLIGVLVWAPATLLGHALERASAGRLLLANTQGSLWQGSGTLLLRASSGFQSLGAYRWRLRPWLGNIELQAGSHPLTQLDFRPFPARLDIHNLRLDLPASLLEIALPQLHPYRLHGSLNIHSEQLHIAATGLNGQITADWTGAASGLSPIAPLGDYRITLHGDQRGLQANMDTLGGKLLLRVNGRFDPALGMLIDGTAQAAPGSEGELNELLHYIGPEKQPGIYTLALMPQSYAIR